MSFNCYKNSKSSKHLKNTVNFLRIISEENRLKILCLLKKQRRCVCEIWQHLKLPQNLTSHHLRVLKDFGLIKSRRSGLKIFYSINRKMVDDYLKLLNKFLKQNHDD